MENPPKTAGRPSTYTDELAATICERIANGESLVKICETAGFPHRITVLKWLSNPDFAAFATEYARAREAQADFLAENMQEVADVSTPEDVQVARLRVLTMQWRASKLAPKRYGDKIDATLTGANGGPLQFQQVARVLVDPQEKPE